MYMIECHSLAIIDILAHNFLEQNIYYCQRMTCLTLKMYPNTCLDYQQTTIIDADEILTCNDI